MKSTLRCVLAAIAFVLCASIVTGQYAIDRSVVAGGGGTSSGGGYSLTGTVGQTEASPTVMTGGGFALEGGFWPGLVVPATGGVPTLFIQSAGLNVSLTWSPASPGFVLQAADTLDALVWTATASNTPALLPITGTPRFYRLIRDP